MPTILIAEDDKQIREALDRILRFEQYDTIVVHDGAAALEARVSTTWYGGSSVASSRLTPGPIRSTTANRAGRDNGVSTPCQVPRW